MRRQMAGCFLKKSMMSVRGMSNSHFASSWPPRSEGCSSCAPDVLQGIVRLQRDANGSPHIREGCFAGVRAVPEGKPLRHVGRDIQNGPKEVRAEVFVAQLVEPRTEHVIVEARVVTRQDELVLLVEFVAPTREECLEGLLGGEGRRERLEIRESHPTGFEG